MDSKSVPYCKALQISPLNLEDLAGRRWQYRQLLILTLLERGEPMSVEDIAERIREAGFFKDNAKLALSLVKSWRNHDSLWRDSAGRFALNLSAPGLEYELLKVIQAIPRPKPTPEPEPERAEEPLHENELVSSFRGRRRKGLSKIQEVAAILDVVGGQLSLAALEQRLEELQCHEPPITDRDFQRWKDRLVVRDGDDVRLTANAEELQKMRQAVRKRSFPISRSEDLTREEAARRGADFIKRRRGELVRLVRQASKWRRALVRVIPSPQQPKAAAILDLSTRSVRTFVFPDELEDCRSALEVYDVLIADEVLEVVDGLGRDPNRWRTIDIRPPHKALKVGHRGRTIQLTTERLLTSTLGWQQSLGDPRATMENLRNGETLHARARLEADSRALATYYRYGSLHGVVRLKEGDLERTIPINWQLQGDLRIFDLLSLADYQGLSIRLTWGSPPRCEDPLAEARLCRLIELDEEYVELESEGVVHDIPFEAIWDVEIVEEPGESLEASR